MSGDERFDVSAALIGELFQDNAKNAEEVERLQHELDDAFQFIRYLIARFGEPHQLDPTRRIIKVDPWKMMDAPYTLVRWDDPTADIVYFGVRVDEH